MDRAQRLQLTVLAAAMAGLLLCAALAIMLIDSAGGTSGPRVGDHWHVPYTVIVCEQAQPPIAEFAHSSGIDTHGDGVMHLHPETPAGEAGGASVAQFFKNSGGWLDFTFAPEGCRIDYDHPLVLRGDSGVHPLASDFAAASETCNALAESDFAPVDRDYIPGDGDCIRIIFEHSRS
jgi:hypothetical protein